MFDFKRGVTMMMHAQCTEPLRLGRMAQKGQTGKGVASCFFGCRSAELTGEWLTTPGKWAQPPGWSWSQSTGSRDCPSKIQMLKISARRETWVCGISPQMATAR